MGKFSFLTIKKEGQSDYRDRGSKFFGYAYPVANVEEAKARLQLLKKSHPKASHFCFAWRFGAEGETARVSDDGEPSGSAGKPIEGQILSRGLTSVLVVVVRYFGGSLLGVPGLIQAYKTAAAEALDQSGQVEKTVEHELVIEFDYTLMNDVMMMIRQVDGRIGSQEMGLFCRYRLMIPLEQKDRAISLLADLRGVTMMENN
jgi:uncharacterized YigZ family protein